MTHARPDQRSHLATLTAISLAGLTCAATLGFGRVFRDGSFVPPALGAAMLPHALGLLARRRRWGLAARLGASAGLLVLYASWVSPAHTVYGLPGPATPRSLGTLASDGWTVLRTGVAPVVTTDGLLLLLVGVVWLLAQLADELAFERDASVGALAPSLVLFVLASTLGTSRHRLQTTVVFGTAAALFLLLQHQSLLEQRRAWFTGPRLARRSGLLGAGTALATSALVAGLVLGPALPGASAGPLLDFRRIGGGRAGRSSTYESKVNPLVDIKSRLTDRPDDELFTVASKFRLNWRLVALDRFDGTQWTLSDKGQDASEGLRHTAGDPIEQDFRIGPLGERWLPAAYEPVAIEGLAGVEVVHNSETLVAAQPSISKLRYKVESVIPAKAPTAAQVAATNRRLPDDLAVDTALPRDFPPEVRQTALAITAGQATRYDKARELERFFAHGSFQYDLTVPEGTGNDALVEFLHSKRGFCEQFAGAYAAMARSIGLPARVAVGFTPGTYDQTTGRLRVTGRAAHAWPEVYLPGLRWTSFEPTPAGDQPGATERVATGTPASTGPTTPGAPGANDVTAPPSPPPTAPSTPATARPLLPGAGISVRSATRHGSRGLGPVDVLIVVTVALTVLGAGYAVAVIALKARRHRRRRDAGDPRLAVFGAWAETLERLDEVGVARRPALTPLELAFDAPRRGMPGDAAGPLVELARAYTAAAWAPAPPDRTAADNAWHHVDEVRRALRDEAPWLRRVRRTLDSASLRS